MLASRYPTSSGPIFLSILYRYDYLQSYADPQD